MLLFECNLWRGCISVTAMAQKSHKKSNIFRPTKFCLFLEISYSYKKNCKFLFQSNHCMQCENSPKILVHFKVGNAKNVRNWFLYSVIKYFEYSQKRANIFCYFYFDIGIHTSQIRGLRSIKSSTDVTQSIQSQYICRIWKYD